MNKNNTDNILSFNDILIESEDRNIIILKDKTISGNKLLKHVSILRSKLKKSSKYGIKINDPYLFILSIIALENYASKIFIFPMEFDSDTVANFTTENSIELILADEFLLDLLKDVSQEELDDIIEYDITLETEWYLFTSGTTDKPKLIKHTLNSLASTIKNDKNAGLEFRWGLLYNVTKFAGLQVILQSILGWGVLIVPEMSSISDAITFLSQEDCNSISATPSLWKKILMLPVSQQLKLRNITLGGEIADQGILNNLKNFFPNARIKHIYASTEAGVGFSVSDGVEGFPESYLAKYNMKIDDVGMLYIKPKVISSNPTKDHSKYITSDGYIETKDIVEKKGNRYIFLGRENGAINIGGQKVFPEKIEQVLLKLDEIEFVIVRPKKSAFMGSIVQADIQLKKKFLNDKEIIKKKILQYCKNQLEHYEVPHIINFVDEIEVSKTGKIKRV